MDRFSKFHPIVNVLFFIFTVAATLMFVNPVFLCISFLCSFLYLLRLNGKRIIFLLKFVLPVVLFAGLFNMIFCRYGVTVLFSVKTLNFTLECLVYGLCAGLMIADAVLWFSAYNTVVTSEKFTSVFGAFAPNTALLFSMVLRFVPLLKKTADEIKEAQTGMGYETSGLKNTVKHFSALVSICLEKSIETADAMKARGYGSKKRKAYSNFRFKTADVIVLILISVLFGFCFFFAARGSFEFTCNPVIELKNTNAGAPAAFLMLCLTPLSADLTEDAKWLYLKSKI